MYTPVGLAKCVLFLLLFTAFAAAIVACRVKPPVTAAATGIRQISEADGYSQAVRSPVSGNSIKDMERAWSTFERLTHARVEWKGDRHGQSPSRDPVWTSKMWSNKCDLILAPCPPSLDKNHLSAGPGLPFELLALRSPIQEAFVQRRLNTARITGGTVTRAHKGESFAAVLFNDKAADGIRRINSPSELARQAEQEADGNPFDASPELRPGSTAIKLIWELVSSKEDPPLTVNVYTERSPQYSTGDKMYAVSDWQTSYRIHDPNGASGTESCEPQPGDPDGSRYIHLNCFYHYVLDATQKNIRKQLEAIYTEIVPPTVVPWDPI